MLVRYSVRNLWDLTVDASGVGGVHVCHRVHVEVQQTVERHELGGTLVVRRELGHEVVLQHSDAETQHGHGEADDQHHQHQQR